jgi:hypothetical protein
MAKLKPDFTRNSFVQETAPRDQHCSCGCGQTIKRGQVCFSRPYIEKGKQKGHNRLVNLDHYDEWVEKIAHEYAKAIVKKRPEAEEYFGRL